MNVQIEDLSSIKKRLSFEVPAEKVESEIERAYQQISKSAKIKGFRAGKIPRSLLEQHYGAQMEQQVLTRLINDSYFKALADHSILAIADPQIVESGTLEKGKAFSYQAEVEIKPEITVRDYKGLSLQKERFVFDEKTIDARMQEIAGSRAEIRDSNREVAANGDLVVIDFSGSIDAVPFEGGTASDHQLELGSGQFIPGFEEQVVGMTVGSDKDITVTFPENYGNSELAGKPAVFRVTLKKVRERVTPELTDDFARGFGLESVAEMRQKLEESYRRQETGRIDGDLREALVKALIEKNPLEVPEALIQSQLQFMLQNIQRRLQGQGMSLEMMGINEESFRVMYRDTAIGQVQGNLLLEAIGKQEGLTVDDSEIDGRLEEIATLSNAPVDAVRKFYTRPEAREGLIAQIVEEKAVRYLLEQATIIEVDKADLAPTDAKE